MKHAKQPSSIKEVRSTLHSSQLEFRESPDGSKILKGYAVVFDSPADIGDFTEYIAPGAFTRTLKDDDQVMLRDHRSELLLGRRSAGTLKLWQDDKGVAFQLTVPNTSLGQDTYENTRLGNLRGCSFGFYVRDQKWSQDANGIVTRTVLDVQCFELTLTAFPAYEATSVDIRSVREALNKGEQPKRTRSENDEDETDCNPDSPDYDPDNDDCDEDERDCSCECASCVADDCDECTEESCDDAACAYVFGLLRQAHMALLLRRMRF